jgi:hypothetical protein
LEEEKTTAAKAAKVAERVAAVKEVEEKRI